MISYKYYITLTIFLFFLINYLGIQITFLFLLPFIIYSIIDLNNNKIINKKELVTICFFIILLFYQSIQDIDNILTFVNNIYLIIFINSYFLFSFFTENKILTKVIINVIHILIAILIFFINYKVLYDI